jgi:hypothetical protein
LNLAIKKATNPDETAPKQKHVRSAFFLVSSFEATIGGEDRIRYSAVEALISGSSLCGFAAQSASHRKFLTTHFFLFAECIVYTWDYRSSASIWASLRVQPILSDEVQTFKGLITVHKILQEGHPIVRLIPLSASFPSPDSLYFFLDP